MSNPAGGQQELPFDPPERLELHLRNCGLAPGAARLAKLVMQQGAPGRRGEDEVVKLIISSREAAARVGCNDRAVRKSAATLARYEWFSIVEVDRRRPPMYVLDVVAARSMPTIDERLDELLAAPPPQEVRTNCGPTADQLRTGADQLRTNCGPLRTAARVLRLNQNQNPCPSPIPAMSSTGSQPESAAVRSGPHRSAAERCPYPWSRESGVSDADLVAAVRDGDAAALRWLYEVAAGPKLRWIVPSDDAWLRFLTAAHHAATARLQRRMGRLVAFVKQGLEVGRCGQASDRWAQQMLARAHRDPALAGRLCERGDEGPEPVETF